MVKKNKIKQINTAYHGIFPFYDKLKNKYDFIDYNNNMEPCFFWGALGEIDKINNHKVLKIVKFLTPLDCSVINLLNESDNLFIISDPHFITNKKFNFINIEFETQNYDIFKPKLLGDKIYCYMRDKVEFQKNILEKIQKKINYEIIYGGEVGDARYYNSIESLKNNYYDKCFLSINLSSKHGYTTVRELGLMGIKTIMNSPYEFPSIIKLERYIRNGNNVIIDEDEIISIIKNESKKINTIQCSMNPHNIKDEWINIEFWENKLYEKYRS
jgi:hypothetical protein